MKLQLIWPILLMGLLSYYYSPVECRRRGGGRQRLPIKDEEGSRHVDKRKKASECRFGDQRYELEHTWHPDLGPPFGVMYCVHCECVPIHKKRRIIGRVQCKNIKTQCPKVTCSDPILLPGRCCKVCPGSEDQNPDLDIQVDLKREEEEKNGRHYASLLSQKSSLASSVPPTTTASATGRLYFRKKTLTYSFVSSPDFGKAKLLTFLDTDGNIVEEFPLGTTYFQEESGKICGTWQQLPRRYRKQLRRDDLYVQLTNENGDMISGRVKKYFGLRSELFSALITSDSGQGPGAATAIVSLDAQTGSVHVNLLISGIFETDGEKNVHVLVKFEYKHNGETRSVEEDLVLAKVVNSLSTIDFTTVIGQPEMEALGQGMLAVSVHAKNAPYNLIRGYLVPRLSCDYFDSIISPLEEVEQEDEDDDVNNQVVQNNSSDVANKGNGLAWMQMDRTGLIKYFLKVNNLPEEINSIQIDNGRKSQRLLRIVHDLEFHGTPQETWANGTFRMNAQDLDAFYHANLYINIGTLNNDRHLRGRIVQNLIGPAQELSKSPILLESSPPNRTMVSGLAWMNVDTTCRMHYQVRLHGIDRREEFQLVLEDHPMKNLKALHLAPGRQLDLQDFRGFDATGHQDSIHKLTLARMDSGDASLTVHNSLSGEKLIEGKLQDVKIPRECKPRFSRNDLEMMPGFLNDLGEEVPGADQTYALKCIYEGLVYEDGSQWKATHESCKMCSCQRGKVVCDNILCPNPTCAQPFLPEGECCPICNNTVKAIQPGSGCHLEGDPVFHSPGSRWHPYIPPHGFSRCATCTCLVDTLKVECHRQKCPILDCPSDQQIRPDALACCMICQPTTTPDPQMVADEEALQTMPEERTDEEILQQGGCQWRGEAIENGHTWSPRVLPFGEVNCVTCTCKEGNAKCHRKECRPLSCKYKVFDEESCCPRCPVNRAETKKAKRLMRILKLRQSRRMRRMKHQQQLSNLLKNPPNQQQPQT